MSLHILLRLHTVLWYIQHPRIVHSRVPVSVECQSVQLTTSSLPTVSLQLLGKFPRCCRHGCLGTSRFQFSIFDFFLFPLYRSGKERYGQAVVLCQPGGALTATDQRGCPGVVSFSPLSVINSLVTHVRSRYLCVVPFTVAVRKMTRFWPLVATAATATATAPPTAGASASLASVSVFDALSLPVRLRLDHAQSWPALIRHNSDRAPGQ